MKSIALAWISSSIVAMRLLVSGPVSSIFCLPTLPHFGSTVGLRPWPCSGARRADRTSS